MPGGAATVNTRQLIVASIVLGLVCCGVMWFLEDFRQQKIMADFQAELAKLPTYLQGGEHAEGEPRG